MSADERHVIDRLERLRVVLPALAQDATEARRAAVQLRSENARLLRRIAELQSAHPTGAQKAEGAHGSSV
jgi:hypothetical protein